MSDRPPMPPVVAPMKELAAGKTVTKPNRKLSVLGANGEDPHVSGIFLDLDGHRLGVERFCVLYLISGEMAGIPTLCSLVELTEGEVLQALRLPIVRESIDRLRQTTARHGTVRLSARLFMEEEGVTGLMRLARDAHEPGIRINAINQLIKLAGLDKDATNMGAAGAALSQVNIVINGAKGFRIDDK